MKSLLLYGLQTQRMTKTIRLPNKLIKSINWCLLRIGLKWYDRLIHAELTDKTKQIPENEEKGKRHWYWL